MRAYARERASESAESARERARARRALAPEKRRKLLAELGAGVLIAVGGGVLAAWRPDLWPIAVIAGLGGVLYAGPRFLKLFVW